MIYIGVLKDFWYWTVTYNLTTYAEFGLKAPPSSGYVTRIVFVIGFGFFLYSVTDSSSDKTAFSNDDKSKTGMRFIFKAFYLLR